MRYFSATCEVWVKPLFRKARPKQKDVVFAANDYGEFLLELRNAMQGKKWQLISWKEITK